MSTKEKSSRTRTWATVVYPDSAPDRWVEILGEQCIPCFISPLHDQDVNPTGESKKPHYHILFCFDGMKSSDQVAHYVSLIGGVGLEKVGSTRGYARYLCHLDNPDKAQYDTAQVRQFGGADYFDMIGLPVDRYNAICEMMDYCDEHGIISYAQLLRVARRDHRDWFRVLCDSGSYVMDKYLKSYGWEQQ